MSHGFDDVGRLFGPDRVLRDWWGPRTVAAYRARGRCLGEYYASYRSAGRPVDGNRTLGEDIADTGAVIERREWGGGASERVSEGVSEGERVREKAREGKRECVCERERERQSDRDRES